MDNTLAVEAPSFSSRRLLRPTGFVEAEIEREGGIWRQYRVGSGSVSPATAGYVVPTLPIEFHCHGIGAVDFSDIEHFDLEGVDRAAAAEGVLCIPTLYIPHSKLDAFVRFMATFARMRRGGGLRYLPAIALEGPLLASFGGTPEMGVWPPSKAEWERLARCGELGLRYMVLSPDALLAGTTAAQMSPDHPSLEWIIALLAEAGIKPALGHFNKVDPAGSAECVERVLRVARGRGRGGEPAPVITDHLFNDMPLKVPHAWRSRQARARRDQEIAEIRLEEWTVDNLRERVGDVPAALVRGARAGELKICLNFDGEHVDPALCRRAVEVIGSSGIILMTDRTDAPLLGGQRLTKQEDSTLWYQEKGIVAAGSQPLDRQMGNMRRMGIGEAEIWEMAAFVPSAVLGIPNPSAGAPPRGCYIAPNGVRHAFADEPEPATTS